MWNRMSVFRKFGKSFSTFGTEEIREILKICEHGFDGVLKKVKIVKCEKGSCLAELKVDEDHANSMNGLHGGLAATLVDSISSYALLTDEKNVMIPSVSVDLQMSFLKGAKVGDEIVIDAETIKAGKNLAYLKCEIKDKGTGEILIKASHTKYFMRPKE